MPRVAVIDCGIWTQRDETVFIMAVSPKGDRVCILCLDGMARWVPRAEVRAEHPEKLETMGAKEGT